MFRSLLFAIGIFLLIFGAQTLVVDKWIMSYASPAQNYAQFNNGFRPSPYRTASFSSDRYYQPVRAARVLKPVYQTQEWMPWSLLAAGTVIVLYSISTRPAAES